MPVPYLPVELVKLIVADPALRKVDLQSLNLTARVFPPLVRPHLFRRLDIPLEWISEDSEPEDTSAFNRAITLRELDRLTSFRQRPDLAGLVREICVYSLWRANVDLGSPPPFLRACGPTLKHLWLGINYDEVPDLSMLPRLESLCVEMRAIDWNGDLSDSLEAWLRTALPTCTTLERLTIKATKDGATLRKTPQGLLAVPEVAAALPATLKRIDFDVLPKEGELEAVLSNNKSVQVIGMPREKDNYPWLDFCRQRGIKVVETDTDEWPA